VKQTVDFLSIGDTQLDTVMVLNPEEVEVKCQLNNENCLMCLDYASKIPVSQLFEMVAGNAANAAVTGARLDGNTAFWTMLGHDAIADRQIKHFQDEGIDISWARKTPGTQSNQSTVVSVSGERTILVFHAPRHYQLPDDLPRARWVYLTSMAKGSESIFTDLATYIEQTGARLAYQPGTFQLRYGAERSRAILQHTAFIIMNKEESQLYTEKTEADIPELLDALLALGPEIAVITDATRGSFAASKDGRWQMGTRPEIPRVEATGAGDAFASAFAVALLHEEAISEAMRWGTLNAESVIQQIGPQAGILTRQQLKAELKRNQEFVAKELS